MNSEDTILTKLCIACKEPIHVDANVCPHCTNVQIPSRWKQAADILKWLGGITAVLSLLLMMIKVNDLFDKWNNEQDAISEIVVAAGIQTEYGDYEQAWESYQNVLRLDPGHRIAREEQINVAMIWLRNIKIIGDQTFTDIVNKLFPVLHRGIASTDKQRRATIFAHIGWANYLKFRENKLSETMIVNEYFDRALKLDPNNTYANAMKAYWLSYRGVQELDVIKTYFERALSTGIDSAFTRRLQFNTIVPYSSRIEFQIEAFRLGNEMRIKGEPLTDRQRRELIQMVMRNVEYYEKLEKIICSLPLEQSLATIQYLKELDKEIDKNEELHYQFISAAFEEIKGNANGALGIYMELQQSLISNNYRIGRLERGVKQAMERLSPH